MKQINQFLVMLCLLPLGMSAQYKQSFDSATMPADWTVINGGDAKTWRPYAYYFFNSEMTPHSGSHFLGLAYSDTAHDDYAISPPILVTPGVSDKLTFWGNNYGVSTLEQFDVKISTTTPTATAFTNTLASNVTPPSMSWKQYTYDLSAYAGQTIYIAFYSSTTDLWFVGIDDFEVSSNTLSVSEAASDNKASIYPNPVKDILYIKNKNKISEASIFDMGGKLQKKQSVNTNNTTLNVSDLSTGTYILKLREGDKEKSYKMIKK